MFTLPQNGKCVAPIGAKHIKSKAIKRSEKITIMLYAAADGTKADAGVVAPYSASHVWVHDLQDEPGTLLPNIILLSYIFYCRDLCYR